MNCRRVLAERALDVNGLLTPGSASLHLARKYGSPAQGHLLKRLLEDGAQRRVRTGIIWRGYSEVVNWMNVDEVLRKKWRKSISDTIRNLGVIGLLSAIVSPESRGSAVSGRWRSI